MLFDSNSALYEYLKRLGDRLRSSGEQSLAVLIEHAQAQALSTATEFLGESKIALLRIQAGSTVLTVKEREALSAAIAQLTSATNRWPQR